jgi:ABC-2 type transport system ATP-binding protein
MTPSPVVQFTRVTRRFDRRTALDDVTLAIPAGAVIGLIGRNGSGKSTLLNHATGLLLPSSGRVTTFGVPSAALGSAELTRIGAMSQQARFIDWMSVTRLVRYVGGFHARWDEARVARLRERLELDGDARVGGLSPGHRQRLGLLLALGHHPELLLLDEPLSDLDPTARRTVLEILLEVYDEDRPTIVISSHLLHDIEPVVTHVVSLANGRVTADAELDVLKERHGANLEQLFPILTGAGAAP